MTTERVHYSNQLLPDVEWEGIPEDERRSEERISVLLEKFEKLMGSKEAISAPLLGKCSRVIKHHRTLKYHFSDELRLRIAKVYLGLYELKDRVTIAMKTKILHSGKHVLRKHWSKIELTMNWRYHWSNLLSLIYREQRYDAVAAHNVLLEHLKAVSTFMFSTRQYFNPYDTDQEYHEQGMSGTLLDYAMHKLSDLRVPSCVEGLLALVLCLPTDFQHYDDYLPRWFEIWATLDHNSIWDCCWLMIFSRARKYSQKFDWNSVLPLLLTKARDLLGIPNIAGVANVNSNSFPKGFPTFYQVILQQFRDLNSKMISKLSKVVFHAIMADTQSTTAGQLLITPPSLIVENMRNLDLPLPGISAEATITVKSSTMELCKFFQSIRPLLHPSNTNNHLLHIARFIEVLVASIAKKVGGKVAETILATTSKEDAVSFDALTWNTFQYLESLVFLISLESVNSKNFMVQRIYIYALNQLVSLNSSFAHLIIPFMMDALEPKSITQPHRTMAALNTLGSCLRTTLYPNPVALKYLPDILRLSLPGVDPSDAKKTVVTLELFTNVFAWLPVKKRLQLKKSTIGHYSDFLSLQDRGTHHSKAVLVSDGDYETQLECILTYIADEWVQAFLDKIFALVDGLEQKVKGAKESPLTSAISQCIGFLFQALVESDDGNKLLYEVEDKILNYILQLAPFHSFKACGKLVEAITTSDSSRLGVFLERILDKEVVTHTASVDKLRFRLVLTGACFRTAKVEEILKLLSVIQPILQEKWFLHHEDVKVRKSFAKLCKDFFKGTTAIFPIEVMPIYSSTAMLGEPNIPTKKEIVWNVPTADSLHQVIVVLRQLTDSAKAEITAALTTALTPTAESNDAPTAALSFKQCEESIANNLLLFVKVVRGLADITGDVSSNPAKDTVIMSTGREAILRSCSAGDRQYLNSYRRGILEMLNEIHDALEQVKDHPVYRGLRDNDYIAKQWMKLLMFTLTRRTAALKDHDGVKKWLKYQKMQHSSVLVRTVYETMKEHRHHHAATATTDGHPWFQLNYWKFHDLNSTYIIFKIWLQHSVRAAELSHAAVRIFVEDDNPQDPVMRGISNLMSLARHEYDSIRPQARKIFEKISSHLGQKLTKIIESTLQLLSLPQATYYQTASTLVTMKQHSVMKRLASNVELKIQFFNSLVSIQQSAAHMTDLDKREKVMLSLTDAITKYAVSWCHSVEDLEILHARIVPSLLAYFGNHSISSDVMEAETAMEIVEEKSTSIVAAAALLTTSTGGLRFDTFLGYLLLHLVSSSLCVGTRATEQRDSNMKNLWDLTFQFLSQGHGQPTQHIGEALFARLSEITYQAYCAEPVSLSSSTWFPRVKEQFHPVENKAIWQKLLLGLARCHPISGADENGGQGAQWSSGIDSLLMAAEYLRIVKTRQFTSKGYEHNLCSIYFRKENAAAFYSLVKCGIINLQTEESLLQYLALTKGIATSSESEKRAVNCVAAEFFCGLLRAVQENVSEQQVHLEKIFLSFLNETIESLSMDFCRDWEEAVFFALEIQAAKSLGPLHRYILDQFHQTLRSNTMTVAATNGNAGDDSAAGGASQHTLDEGFSKQGKTLMFVIAILNADCIARVTTQESQLLVANEILQTLLHPETNIIIPYRSSRMELASIITTLTDHLAHNNSQSDHQAALTALFEKLTAEVQRVMTTTTAAEEGVSEQQAETGGDLVSAGLGKNLVLRNTIDTIFHIVPKLTQRVPIGFIGNILLSLFPVLFQGVIYSEPEINRNASDSLLYLSNAFAFLSPSLVGTSPGPTAAKGLMQWLQQLSDHYDQFVTSWKIKEVLLKLHVTLMINNWFLLHDPEKKIFKDLFTKGLNDLQLNVRDVAAIGMVAYLTYKTPQEMKAIAESYTRNSETLATREKQKRKLIKTSEENSNSTSITARPEPQYLLTIQMISCVILATSYDLPDYLPNLLSSFLRHVHFYDMLKSVITKTVQLFKRTHQDRWEEFQLKFTSDQLADLQGAGAAHYFS